MARDGPGRGIRDAAAVLQIDSSALRSCPGNKTGIRDRPGIVLDKDPDARSRNEPRREVRKTAATCHQHSVMVGARDAARISDRADTSHDENAGAVRTGTRNGCARGVGHAAAGEETDAVIDSRGDVSRVRDRSAATWTMTPSSPPVIELMLVTRPPAPIATP